MFMGCALSARSAQAGTAAQALKSTAMAALRARFLIVERRGKFIKAQFLLAIVARTPAVPLVLFGFVHLGDHFIREAQGPGHAACQRAIGEELTADADGGHTFQLEGLCQLGGAFGFTHHRE